MSQKLMLSCKDVVNAISKDPENNWAKNFKVRLHLFFCKHCSKYAKQIQILKNSAKNFFQSKNKQIDENKIKELENKILNKFYK